MYKGIYLGHIGLSGKIATAKKIAAAKIGIDLKVSIPASEAWNRGNYWETGDIISYEPDELLAVCISADGDDMNLTAICRLVERLMYEDDMGPEITCFWWRPRAKEWVKF